MNWGNNISNSIARVRPASIQDYQAWLAGIGIYATSTDWSQHDMSRALPLFTIIDVKIDLRHREILSIKTDNPEIGCGPDTMFNGTVIDCVDIQVLKYKERMGMVSER